MCRLSGWWGRGFFSLGVERGRGGSVRCCNPGLRLALGDCWSLRGWSWGLLLGFGGETWWLLCFGVPGTREMMVGIGRGGFSYGSIGLSVCVL